MYKKKNCFQKPLSISHLGYKLFSNLISKRFQNFMN